MERDELDVRAKEPRETPVRPWLWQGIVFLLVTVLVAGLGLVAALALGLGSPTPRRAPDWTATGAAWRRFGDGSVTASDDSYEISLSQPGQRAWAVANLSIADFDLELNVRSLLPSEDVGFGLLYRYQDPANHYLFAIGGDGYYTIARIQGGKQTPLRAWQQWPHVRRGAATNRLRVRCREARCRFYVNGEFAAEITDDAFLAGKLGLWAQSFSDDVLAVRFYGMRLWSLN